MLLLQRVLLGTVADAAYILPVDRLHVQQLGFHLGDVEGTVLVENGEAAGVGERFGVTRETIPRFLRGHLKGLVGPCGVRRAFLGSPWEEGGTLCTLPCACSHKQQLKQEYNINIKVHFRAQP